MTELLVLALSFAFLWKMRTIIEWLEKIADLLTPEDRLEVHGFTHAEDEDEEWDDGDEV